MSGRTRSSTRAAIAALIAAFLLPVDVCAAAREEVEPPRRNPVVAGVAAGFDVVILRPLGLVVVATGAAAFVPIALVTAPGGLDSVETALKIFVTEPGRYVFLRPLGDF
jgi:hypothetical protein